MTNQEIDQLFEKYRAGTCSPEERRLVETWYLHWQPQAGPELSPAELEADLAAVRSNLPTGRRPWKGYRFAAAAAVVFAMVGLFMIYRSSPVGADSHRRSTARILPGGNHAVLTLANGKKMILDSVSSGVVLEQGGLRISKSKDGLLTYSVQSQAGPAASSPAYNTISTPRGGQYRVNLPDGTQVWLNAASSLRFPVSFAKSERRVDLSGEAYFEVSKDASRPFLVATSRQQVRVLGTHFNVTAYEEESRELTTLLEGRVRVERGQDQWLMKPGQQLSNQPGNVTVRSLPDAEQAIAWKNGIFSFDQESLYDIMNKIARWYNVSVEYRGDFRDRHYGGNISRFSDVSEVLQTMQLTGTVKFKIEGRRIIVMH
ncbi:anti-sigma factor [Pedobacter yulinensis]|uniref:Anti-sigma factor n=1 Tax=Pedobacter yulinensis TaxID=2126353 RepID=A0A2T3HKC5_9SPHI|nr:FecR family protein [Pedobacter yulinensis]PST82886.1 anti-sigma factor [Pedobacter yulinensis]